jgi:hypothetical protein
MMMMMMMMMMMCFCAGVALVYGIHGFSVRMPLDGVY